MGFAMYGWFFWEYFPRGRLWLDRFLIDRRCQGRGCMVKSLYQNFPGGSRGAVGFSGISFGIRQAHHVLSVDVLFPGEAEAGSPGGPPVRSACLIFPGKGITAKGGILHWKFIPSPSPKAAGARFWPWSFCRSSGATLNYSRQLIGHLA